MPFILWFLWDEQKHEIIGCKLSQFSDFSSTARGQSWKMKCVKIIFGSSLHNLMGAKLKGFCSNSGSCYFLLCYEWNFLNSAIYLQSLFIIQDCRWTLPFSNSSSVLMLLFSLNQSQFICLRFDVLCFCGSCCGFFVCLMYWKDPSPKWLVMCWVSC